jgi:hypothetical protein
MGWLDSIFGGLSNPDYDKMFEDRMMKEQQEREIIFDYSKSRVEMKEWDEERSVSIKKAKNKEHKEKARKERKKEEKAADDLKLVLDGAKLQCTLCANPIGELKVNFDTPTIQNKKTATVKEKDMKSLMFKGNCTKSPQSASPCAGVMQLDKWKDVGTSKVQDQFPLLLKSTIKCNYGGTDIKIMDCGQKNEPSKVETKGAPVPPVKPLDFDITLKLDKAAKTIVPFGIKDFKNNIENPFFSFKYTLRKSKIDSLDFQIMDDNDAVIYEIKHLEPVIIKASKKPSILFEAQKQKEGPLVSKTWDYQEAYKQHALFEPADYTQEGEYYIHWDGFDSNEIYDSTRFNGKDLKAKITAIKGGKQKSVTVDFSTTYSQVQWTDVKINKKTKRIDVTLRVNFYDGGAKGLKCNTYSAENEMSYETFTPTTNQPDPFKDVKTSICDWDKIPKNVLRTFVKSPIKSRTKTFEELKVLAIKGLEKYWSRNKNNAEGKNVKISGLEYEVFVNAINFQDKKKTMDDIPLVYHTNGGFGRSGNFGGSYQDHNLDDNLINLIPDTGLVQQLSYNTGYIKNDWKDDKLGGWRFYDDIDNGKSPYAAISKFKETAAHEIGHEILQAYYGTTFSWQHKGSSYYIPQNTKPIKGNKTIIDYVMPDFMTESSGEEYPKKGEIDLMKYYNNTPNPVDQTRIIAAVNDILGLIWLTKIKVK